LKKLKWLFQPVLIFVVAQVSWALLMAVWIRWYVVRINEIDELISRFPIKENFGTGQWVVLVEGCLLMGIILVGLYIIFVSLRRQTKLNRMQDSILSNVTHELKTPLASIRLYTETLLLRDLGPAEREKFLRRSLSETERLQKLIDTVLISARMTAEKTHHDFQRVAIKELVSDSWKKTLERFGETRAFSFKVTPDIPVDQVFVHGNSLQLSIVFDNLLDNSVKYTEQGGRIHLDLEITNQWIRIALFDDGMGLEKKSLKKVFQRFYRAEKASLHKVQGSGLGLFASYSIVKAHRGKLFATSDGLGKGSCFHVELPRETSDY
jgi:signal transduction histidine kinase